MIKVALSFILIACALYGWRERKMSPLVGYCTPMIAATGVLLILYPALSNQAAHLLGVGRGADLVFYLWTAISVLLIANVHFRLRYQHAMLTTVTRELAILNARGPRQPPT